MSMATPQVYVAELERLKFGRPLYNPEHPVDIGDVGFFERDTGNFCPLFNVFRDATDQANAELGSPNDFVPLSRTHLRITTTNDYFPPQPIKSGSVESKGVELEASANAIIPAGAGITFSCANKLGATLLLRAATTRADVADNRFVHEYILKHIDSWYDYAYQLGYGEVQAPEGSIVLIKGCDKTSSWAHATFAERSREASVFFNGGYFDVGGTVRLQGSWSGAVSAIYREAPLGGRQVHPVRFSATHQHPRIMDPSQVATSSHSPPSAIFPDDCTYSVFARVYRIRRRSVLGMAKFVTVNVDGGTTRHLQHRSPSTTGPSTPGPEPTLQGVSSFSTHPSSHQAKSHAAQGALPTLIQHFQIPSLRAASTNDPTLALSAQTHRPPNISSSSTATTSSPEHGDLIRAASSLLFRELGRGGGQLRRNGFSEQDWEETENRMRNLIRLERMWGRSGTGAPGNGSLASGASGEDRERRAFAEALRDGYVLCQFMNKLRPGLLTNPSTRDDGFVRTSNVTRFLATCSQQGVPAEDLFQRDDLIEASAESLARVAWAVLSLFKIMEAPTAAEHSHMLKGGGSSGTQQGPDTRSPATELTPNPALAWSTSSTVSSLQQKRWSPPDLVPPTIIDHGLDTLREKLGPARPPQVNIDHLLLVSPPPWSPFHIQRSLFRKEMFEERSSLTGRSSPGESQTKSRRTSSTRTSSTFDTMTTDASSIHVSDEGGPSASMSEELGRKQPDLQRVAEETESAATSSSGRSKKLQSSVSLSTKLGNTDAVDLQERERARKERINLGKAKWPEDFLAAPRQNYNAAAVAKEFAIDGSIPPPLSISPTSVSNLSRAMAAKQDQSNRVEPPLLTLKRPSHRARHSVDTGGLLPRPSRLRTEFGDASPIRAGLRRNYTPKSAGTGPRSADLLPRIDRARDPSQPRKGGLTTRVPFPRSTSGEYNFGGSPRQHSPPDFGSSRDHPRVPLERFTSEVDGASSRRQPWPTSVDVQVSKLGRSRFESMINLGGDSSMSIASDIKSRDSVDVGQTLVVKGHGKAAVQYQLGNCIGRGRLGSVYRALNTNTGQIVAIKRIRLEGLKEDGIKQLMGEVDFVKSLSHPSIVKYEGMARDPTTLNVVLEFAENGSLGQTLKAFGKLNEQLVANYVVKILDGLLYLHQSHVVHCNLKATNVLTTITGNVKLSDFGLSLNLRNPRHMEMDLLDAAVTPNWMAPEVIELQDPSYASDIWSLACTVIELLTGKPPYSDVRNSMSVMFRIVEDDMPPLPEGCSELLEDFLRQCFNKDPSKRPTAEDLCEHEWLKVTWVPGKDPRQQDTIPFIRRISTDVKQSSPSIARYIAQIAKSPRSEMGDSDDGPKPTPDLSTPSLEGESWDEEASIMVDPDLQLGGHILDYVLDYILKKVPGADVVIATDEDLFTLCPDLILPSDIADMLNNLQPPCHASVAFGGKTLATLKESTMVSSHGSQDHFQANAKSFSSQVHAFVPSVEEEDHNQDDDDMGGGNSKGKSKDTKSSANIEAPAQAATQSTTPPAENKNEIRARAPSRGSWLGRWLKRRSSTTPAPVEASVGDQSDFYYDKELKKWVKEMAGVNATKATAVPPEARSILAGAPPPLQPTPVPHGSLSTRSPPVASALSRGTPRFRRMMMGPHVPKMSPPAPPPGPGDPKQTDDPPP